MCVLYVAAVPASSPAQIISSAPAACSEGLWTGNKQGFVDVKRCFRQQVKHNRHLPCVEQQFLDVAQLLIARTQQNCTHYYGLCSQLSMQTPQQETICVLCSMQTLRSTVRDH